MKIMRFILQPRTAFGGALRGDTFFGQLCWAIRHRFGVDRLEALLSSYPTSPFAVCSDAFPSGYLPRPALPIHRFAPVLEDRKRIKRRRWLPLGGANQPVNVWLADCVDDHEVAGGEGEALFVLQPQPHNSIHRGLSTTFGGEFAPYTQQQTWFRAGLRLDLWLLLDSEQLERAHVEQCVADVGRAGYGRDASAGLGKFDIDSSEETALPHHGEANSCFTLAPCAPQGLGFDQMHSFYMPFTRFGRHGDQAVLGGKPFKNPVLLADTAAILSPPILPVVPLVGQALGGNGTLSKEIEGTVHQGFAPCVFVRMEEQVQ